MPSNAPPTPPESADSSALRVEQALQLLQQSGLPPPPGAPGSAAWTQGLIDALCDLSSRDALTGLANRRSFETALGREIDRVARSGEPALLLLLDIDHFKRVNDTHGHAVGDQVLVALAPLLRENTRAGDVLARIGGEEFVIVFADTPAERAQEVCDRLRQRLKRHTWPGLPAGQTVTLSIGLAGAPRYDAAELMQRADAALYEAKRRGRDRVCLG